MKHDDGGATTIERRAGGDARAKEPIERGKRARERWYLARVARPSSRVVERRNVGIIHSSRTPGFAVSSSRAREAIARACECACDDTCESNVITR